MKIEDKLIESIESLKEEAFQLNRCLFDNPELSGKEYNSVKKIVEVLNKYGIKTRLNYCDLETSFLGKVIENKDSNVKIGILTEYDALPGVGHACGHSASCAISVLSALAIKKNEEDIKVNVDIIGTPDEENEGLKIPMAEKGAFDDYDYVIMVHLDTKNRPNWKLLAFETYKIEFFGKPAHAAASPWEGNSALDGLMLAIHGFDMMRKCTKPGTIIEGYITEGGVATNIITDYASGMYTFRSNDFNYIKSTLIPWMENIVYGCAKATRTKAKITKHGYPFMDMKYNNIGTKIISDIMKKYQMENYEQEKAVGSSDIGNVSYRCPSFHPSVAITNEDISLHTKEFAELVGSDASKMAIENGAKTILGFIGRTIDDKDLIKKIKLEFNGDKNGL
ncbi:amidohydrolase [Peptoniphilus sp. AGMB00490]|uniref:Peptidase M20 domain-containing protein 2 n=1 Tax=Peptoniphilus faecalis TaxID=2731255 RepID=A0A848RFS2_9FIRM|nr:amidohydrolase [Peptoniphilus faecalis]NMW85670.1 amidohydrolase [Peptoniphilus faecalis]